MDFENPYIKKDGELTRDYVARVLEYNIILLNLKPGQMISEVEISPLVGASRTPTHEAFLNLVRKGLLEILPQKGTRVTLIDENRINSICFVRYAVEMKIIDCLIEGNIDEIWFDKMKICVDQQKLAMKENLFIKAFDLDTEIHELLAEACGKRDAYEVIKPSISSLNRIRLMIYKNNQLGRIIEEHEKIISALRVKDFKMVKKVMSTHLVQDFTDDLNRLKTKYPDYFKI